MKTQYVLACVSRIQHSFASKKFHRIFIVAIVIGTKIDITFSELDLYLEYWKQSEQKNVKQKQKMREREEK